MCGHLLGFPHTEQESLESDRVPISLVAALAMGAALGSVVSFGGCSPADRVASAYAGLRRHVSLIPRLRPIAPDDHVQAHSDNRQADDDAEIGPP